MHPVNHDKDSDPIHGYTFGAASVQTSPVTLRELDDLKTTLDFTAQDEAYLKLAGDVLADQAEQIVHHWRSDIIASIPNLARHSRSPEGEPLPEYLAQSNLRFRQWILDTCLRPYDQNWLNYQHEIALRHTSLKKNKTDGVRSTSHVPFRDIMAFVVVMNETMRTFLAAKGHPQSVVDGMHLAWSKSVQLQLALWGLPYSAEVNGEW